MCQCIYICVRVCEKVYILYTCVKIDICVLSTEDPLYRQKKTKAKNLYPRTRPWIRPHVTTLVMSEVDIGA